MKLLIVTQKEIDDEKQNHQRQFDIWQRGTSFTASGLYTADRWKQNHNTGAATYRRQAFTLGQTNVPGEPRYYMNVNVTSAAASTSNVIRQRVEGVRTLAGQQATVSFYAKATAAKTFHVVIAQNFGTGGSPSTSVQVMSTAQSIGTIWARYKFTFNVDSISGKTIGTNGDDYSDFNIREGISFSTFSLDIAQVQLEAGPTATDYEDRPIGQELMLAQRYYAKTYNLETDPGAVTSTGSVDGSLNGAASNVHAVRVHWKYPVRMRAIPAITYYSKNGTVNKWDKLLGNLLTVTAQKTGEQGVNVEASTITTGDARVGGQIVADAEL